MAAAEMAFAGGLGIEIELQPLAEKKRLSADAVLLFSESNTRFLLEVPLDQVSEFESVFIDLPSRMIGRVTNHNRVQIRGTGGPLVIDTACGELKRVWQQTLAWD